ncbi:MAG: hypothetical protein HEQ38_12555 [Gemmatimonas sp.]|nr:hypothetical protein [Gemmatimonas sp.]
MTAPAMNSAAVATGVGRALETRLGGEQQSLATRGTIGATLAAVAALAAVLAASTLVLGDGRWLALPAPLPLLLAVTAVSGAGAMFLWRWRALQSTLRLPTLAGAVEREQQLREGSLRGALEVAGTGALGARAADDVARRLKPGTLAPGLASALTTALLVAAGAAVVGLALLVGAARAVPDGLAAVLQPVSAWRGTLLPALAFDKLTTRVPRGMPVTVRVVATGRQAVTVSRRSEGEAWSDTLLTVPD